MNKRTKISILGLIILVVTLIVVWMQPSNKKQPLKTATYKKWDEKYGITSKQPYGLYQWNAALRKNIQKNQPISTIDYLYSIDTIAKEKPVTFLFVGDEFVLFKDEVTSVFERVNNGSTLVIAQNKMDSLIYRKFIDSIYVSYYYDTSVLLTLQQKNYQFTAQFQNYTVAHQWLGYTFIQPKEGVSMQATGGVGKLMATIEFTYGKGKIILNTMPILFTNHQILTDNGVQYGSEWLNAIPKNQPLYWLELGRYKEPSFESSYEEEESNYLQFLFDHKNRVIAIALFVIGLLLILLFRTKRMQRLVPYIAPKRNMSLIFTDTITSIYYNKRNPYVMMKQQRAALYHSIQKNYQIDCTKELSEQSILYLAEKTNYSPIQLTQFISQLNQFTATSTSEEDLLAVRQEIIQFYRTAGLISKRTLDALTTKETVLNRNEIQSLLFIISGSLIIILGMNLLVKGIGMGILFWPIGISIFTWGILRLSKPYISWSKIEFSFYPLFGTKKTAKLEELIQIEQTDKDILLQFETKRILINLNELNRANRKQLLEFVDAHNKLKL